MPRTAVLLGATGLVGGHVLDELLADTAYSEVTTLGRRRLLDRDHPKLTQHVIDFDRLDEHAELLGADDIFCCLGTTIAQAGSKEAFRRVDYVYPLRAAEIAVAQGSEQYLLVSATGASQKSLFFYSRVKGEVEDDIGKLPFYGTYLLRPSLLVGKREEARLGEAVGEKVLGAVSFALRGPLSNLGPIEAHTVAAAMIELAKQRPGGVNVYEPDDLRALAEG